jgi:hypothetical protein
MGWNGIGWFAGAFLGAAGTGVQFLWPDARAFGYALLAVAGLCLLGALLGAFQMLFQLMKRIGAKKMMLVVGIVGSWVFLTLSAATVVWMLVDGSKTQIAEAGPLSWIQNFSMEGGMNGVNVFSLRFRGANVSKEPIQLKSASITSLIDGTHLPLEIAGNDQNGETNIRPIDQAQLIPPGAPIELVAKFGLPDPQHPGNILGLDPKVFLEKWRQIAFDAVDAKRTYHFELKENAFMPFFQGKVGPRVTFKTN